MSSVPTPGYFTYLSGIFCNEKKDFLKVVSLHQELLSLDYDKQSCDCNLNIRTSVSESRGYKVHSIVVMNTKSDKYRCKSWFYLVYDFGQVLYLSLLSYME